MDDSVCSNSPSPGCSGHVFSLVATASYFQVFRSGAGLVKGGPDDRAAHRALNKVRIPHFGELVPRDPTLAPNSSRATGPNEKPESNGGSD